MKTIFVVEGSTGSYEDRYDWAIAAYDNLEDAKEHMNKAQDFYYNNISHLSSMEKFDGEVPRNPYDTDNHTDWDGKYYSIRAVEFFSNLEEYTKYMGSNYLNYPHASIKQ